MRTDPSPPVTLAVIIPTIERGTAGALTRTIATLLADPATTELIVVLDRGSEAFEQSVIGWFGGDPRGRLLRSHGAGETGARQQGLEAASSAFVLFLDDDVEPAPGLASGHCRLLAAEPDAVVTGYMPVALDGRRPGDSAQALYAAEYERRCEEWESGEVAVLDGFWAGNFALSRAHALTVGMTSPEFDGTDLRHGDRDFGLRCAALGLTGRFDRDLASTHHFERTVRQGLGDVERNVAGGRMLASSHASEAGQRLDDARYRRGVPRAAVPALRLANRTRIRAATVAVTDRLVVALGHLGRFREADLVFRTARAFTEVRAALAR